MSTIGEPTMDVPPPKDLVVKTQAALINCPHCEIKTMHWPLSNGKTICGFCGTEH